MHVVQLITRRQLRGAEVFAAQLCDALTAAGHQAELAALFSPRDLELRPQRAELVDLGADRDRQGLSLALLRRLARHLDLHRPDLVQANGSDTLKYSVLAGAFVTSPHVLVYRNISVLSRWLRGPLHRLWVGSLLRRVDHVVSVSRRSRQDLLGTLHLPEKRVSFIPRGVDTEFPTMVHGEAKARLAERVGCDPGRPTLVHIGSFTPEKNHAGLLDVLHVIGETRPDVQLVLFGAGPEQERVRRRAERLAGRVYFGGSTPDAAELARGADVFVLFSTVEGTPGVVLEAGARGLAVVASDVGGVSELVRHGETGLLVERDDVRGCARAILELLDAPDLRLRLGGALCDHVQKHYSLSKVVDRYLELYRALTNSRQLAGQH